MILHVMRWGDPILSDGGLAGAAAPVSKPSRPVTLTPAFETRRATASCRLASPPAVTSRFCGAGGRHWAPISHVGYSPVTASPLHSCPTQFTLVRVGSRAAPCPVSCTPANPGEFTWTVANCVNTLKSCFLNLGSGVRFPSGTPTRQPFTAPNGRIFR